MAEVAIGFMSAIGSAGAAIGTAVTSAIGGLSTIGTILQGVATAGSMLMQIQAGKADQAQANTQSQIALLQGDQAQTASEERALHIREDALMKMGQARVAFAGSGLDISSGQLNAIEGNIAHQEGFQLAIEKNNAAMSKAEAELKAGQLSIRGENAAWSSNVDAFGTGIQGLLSIVKRG